MLPGDCLAWGCHQIVLPRLKLLPSYLGWSCCWILAAAGAKRSCCLFQCSPGCLCRRQYYRQLLYKHQTSGNSVLTSYCYLLAYPRSLQHCSMQHCRNMAYWHGSETSCYSQADTEIIVITSLGVDKVKPNGWVVSRVVLDCSSSTMSLSTWVVVVAGGLQHFTAQSLLVLDLVGAWLGLGPGGFGTKGFGTITINHDQSWNGAYPSWINIDTSCYTIMCIRVSPLVHCQYHSV